MLSSFKTINLGKKWSLFLSGWPLGIPNMELSFKGWNESSAKWTNCYLKKKVNGRKKETSITCKEIKRQTDMLKYIYISTSFQCPNIGLYLGRLSLFSPQWLTPFQVFRVYTICLANYDFSPSENTLLLLYLIHKN